MMAKALINPESILTCYVALVSLVLMCECVPSTNTSTISGFTTHVFHRDSPQSPFYNASTTRLQLLASAAERSLSRSKHIYEKLQANTPHSMITAGEADYLMRLSLGTPVIGIIAIADTGSDMIWTQCEPCKKCFPQRRANFEPQFSSTYKNIGCNSQICSYVAQTTCDAPSGNCVYYAFYADGSASNGPVATETFYFGSDGGERLEFPNIVFGCGETNTGNFDSGGSGIVGLGGGRESLVRQLGFDKFSYCLMPLEQLDKESMMHFGADGDVNGDGVVRTPMSLRSPPTHYFLTLQAVSVADKRLKYPDPFLVDGIGNIVIDSGSTHTLVPPTFYEDWQQAVTSRIALRPVRSVPGWPLCYLSRNDIMIPKIVFHFKEADVEWSFHNAFVRVHEDMVCFAAAPVQGGVTIYGGVAQANFLVGYDLQKRLVSFKPTDCGNHR